MKSQLLNIVEIEVEVFYYLARNKENKLFSLIINEIFNSSKNLLNNTYID